MIDGIASGCAYRAIMVQIARAVRGGEKTRPQREPKSKLKVARQVESANSDVNGPKTKEFMQNAQDLELIEGDWRWGGLLGRKG